MERLLKPYDKEFMKMAMLKHEETFKQQVHELHRLYRIQKTLMMKSSSTDRKNNSRPNGKNQERWDSRNGIISLNQMSDYIHQKQPPPGGLDLEQPAPAEEYVTESDGDGDGELEMEDESEIRLTLGPPRSYYPRRKKAETPPSSDSGPSFSSSSGTDTTTTREELRGHKWGLRLTTTMVPDSNYGFQSGRKTSFQDVEEEQLSLRSQDRRLKQPPWLFQALSLNMT